ARLADVHAGQQDGVRRLRRIELRQRRRREDAEGSNAHHSRPGTEAEHHGRAAVVTRKMIEDHYRAIIEAAEGTIFIADREGSYRYGSARAAANLGLTQEQVGGNTVDELLPPHVADQFREGCRQVIDSGETLRSEDYLVVDGVEFWSSTRMQPLRDASGRVT